MNILIFGATGMVGQGALLAALKDPRVHSVTTVGRNPTHHHDPRLRDLTVPNLFDLTAIAPELANFDACFFALGVSSFRMSEADYRRITHDLTVSVAQTLLPRNPAMAFLYVSGAGTDSTGKGRSMWARVKGQTENELLALPFRAAYMLRPGLIVPKDGIRSKTVTYQAIYTVLTPVLPLLQRLFPTHITDTRRLGQAMITLSAVSSPNRILENRDIAHL